MSHVAVFSYGLARCKYTQMLPVKSCDIVTEQNVEVRGREEQSPRGAGTSLLRGPSPGSGPPSGRRGGRACQAKPLLKPRRRPGQRGGGGRRAFAETARAKPRGSVTKDHSRQKQSPESQDA